MGRQTARHEAQNRAPRPPALVLGACGDPDPNQAVGTELSIEICAPTGTFSPNITNRFFPMPVGQKLVLEEAGGGARVEITSLAETETVGAKIGVEVAAGRFVATVVLRHRA